MKSVARNAFVSIALTFLLMACATPELQTVTIDMPMTVGAQKYNLTDDDSDGVINGREKCMSSLPGSQVDNNGCSDDVVDKVRQELQIQFANNSAVVSPNYFKDIQQLAEFMKTYSSLNVVIEGHTSKQGSSSHNIKLSKQRAKAVADILVAKFNIPSSRVSAVGYGFSRLLNDGHTEQAHSMNRRIVAELSNEVVSTNLKWTIYSVDDPLL